MDVGLRRIYPHIPLCLRPPDSRALTRVADVAARSRLRRAQGEEAPRLPWPLVQAPVAAEAFTEPECEGKEVRILA